MLLNISLQHCKSVSLLQICANLDASKIMTRDLGKHKKERDKIIVTVEDRKEVHLFHGNFLTQFGHSTEGVA